MAKFKIPVVYEMWGLIEIEADNLEAAKELALQGGLPANPEYIDSSFKIDEDSVSTFNENVIS